MTPSTPAQVHDFCQDLVQAAKTPTQLWPAPNSKSYSLLRRHLRDQLKELYHAIAELPEPKPERDASLRVLGESALTLLDLHWRYPTSYLQPSEEFASLVKDRPEAILDYDQLYCSPDSTERRIARILESVDSQSGRVLFMGDDDLGSIALSNQFEGEIHTMELDTRLLDYIKEKAPQTTCHQIDLFLGGIPKDLQGYFDAIMLDPPWDEYHAWCFLHKADLCLKQSHDARIFMSFCPLNVEHLHQKAQPFFQRFAQKGFVCEHLIPGHHLYPLQGTEFLQLLLSHIPPFESTLLDCLRTLPFGFSHLYVFRRCQTHRTNRLYSWFTRWWHSA